MSGKTEFSRKGSFRRKFSPVLLIGWTGIVLVMLIYEVHDGREHRTEQAMTSARTYYDLNLAYRKMVSNIGGVYAPIEKVAPNPYLNVPNREVRLSDGKTLTLINPAYMTRLAFDVLQTVNNDPIKNRLISLKYLNPDNAPNDWERQALLSFEAGAKEASRVIDINGAPFLVLVKPFMTEEGCLKCHGHQGYKSGDVRGGISIAVPLKTYYETAKHEELRELISYFFLWSTGILGLLIFSRHRYEQDKRIIESEWKFRTVAETTEDWEFWISPEGSLTFMSPACVEITGYSVEEFTDDPGLLTRIIHTDERDKWISHNTDLQDPSHRDMEFRIITRDGTVKWIAHKCAPMYKDGIFIGRRSNNRDITERRRVEDELNLTKHSVDNIADSVFWIDRSARLVFVNKAVCRNLGYTREELLGMTVFDIDPIFPREKWDEHWNELLQSDHFVMETVHRTKDGRDIAVEVTANHLEFGGTHYNCAIARDVSERKRLEEQLRQAQKMESIGTLAGGIAHDFNNILTAISGYGHLTMLKMPPDDPNRLNMEQILEASDRAAHLTKDLLLFSRKQAIERKPLDLNEVVQKLEKFIGRIIGEDIKCNARLYDGRLTVMADRHQIEQVLMNLATNARDAMRKGGVLTISTELIFMDEHFFSVHGYGKPGRYALLSISDTGAGMDADVRQRIFEPFFTTKEVGKGTGLGLAVVYGIIKQHDGYINVYSEPGQGTIFRIYIPVVLCETDSKEHSAEAEPVGGTETILLAEDDAAVRSLTETILTEFGYTVISANDGLDAIQKYLENREKIDLMIFDLIMPRKSGKEACDEIRKTDPDVKVIFSSGYSPDVIRDKASLGEDAEVLYKPVTPTDLLRKVRCTLDGRHLL